LTTVQVFTPDSRPFGFTYGEWTTRWWQWLLSKPKDTNPAIDDTGKNAGVDQHDPNVWFLAGTFVNMSIPHRTCAIPEGKAILFPVINYQANFLEDPKFTEESELKEYVGSDIDDIVKKEAFVNGIRVPVFRVGSDPSLFSVKIAADIPHGVDGSDDGRVADAGGGITKAVSDGYWVFLQPLPIGEYDIHFAGACSGGLRRTEAFYHLTVK
jgi:hypothetical protein